MNSSCDGTGLERCQTGTALVRLLKCRVVFFFARTFGFKIIHLPALNLVMVEEEEEEESNCTQAYYWCVRARRWPLRSV